MKKIFAIILTMLVMVGTVDADTYITGSANRSDINIDGTSLDKSNGYAAGMGVNLNKWLAVEATYGQSGRILSDTAEVKTVGAWVVADPTVLKIGTMPLKLIARGGFVYNNVNIHNGSNEYDKGYSYGGGIGLGITPNVDVILDYRVMDIDISGFEDLQFDTVGLGFNFNF